MTFKWQAGEVRLKFHLCCGKRLPLLNGTIRSYVLELTFKLHKARHHHSDGNHDKLHLSAFTKSINHDVTCGKVSKGTVYHVMIQLIIKV